MFATKSSDITVYDDDINDFGIIQNIIDSNNQENAFYIADIGTVLQQHKKWLSAMPEVVPYYAVKCNPNDTVIRVLASFNGGFDCASKGEIEQVIRAGVSRDRIVFAHPHKLPSHIKYAKKVGVRTMMVDDNMEVLKIKEIYPDARIVIRLAIDAKFCRIKMSSKFGCEPTDGVTSLMKFIKQQQMHLQGFSFHLGTPCWDPPAYAQGIKICAELIKIGRLMGFKELNLIDIGGGFPGTEEEMFHKIAGSVNEATADLDRSVRVISEPGRYYVQSAFTLATLVYSKRMLINERQLMIRHYYINDSIFGSFLGRGMGFTEVTPLPLRKMDESVFPSVIWGPTCAPIDCICDDVMIQNLSIGDWIVWRDMGSYTLSVATKFNGFLPPTVFPVIRRKGMKELLNNINILPKFTIIEGLDQRTP